MVRLFSVLFSLVISSSLMAQSGSAFDQRDKLKDIEYQKKCLKLKKYVVKGKMDVDCYKEYHHYNSKAYRKFTDSSRRMATKRVKIAGYNVLHPGSSKAMFKDLTITAKMLNQWDLIGTTELLADVGVEEDINDDIYEFRTKTAPAQKKAIEAAMKKLLTGKMTAVKERKAKELKAKMAKLKNTYLESTKHYRAPGYYKILLALQKLDPSWSLLLSPRGEALNKGNVQELVGYYYRARVVRPENNQYCWKMDKVKRVKPFACIAQMSERDLGKDVRRLISRRPFIASFQSGSFDFTMLTSHVVFNPPLKESSRQDFLKNVYGVKTIKELSENYPGVNKLRMARFAEVKFTLDLIKKIKSMSSEQDIIWTGDFNLESRLGYWQMLLKDYPGMELFIDTKTSVKLSTINPRDVATEGKSKNYDHFLFAPSKTKECMIGGNTDAREYHFMYESINRDIEAKYLIRKPMTFTKAADADAKIKRITDYYDRIFKAERKLDKVKLEFVFDEKLYKFKMDGLKKRVFESQFVKKKYYQLYKEVMSDHIPIFMTCSNRTDDDREDRYTR